MQSLRLISHVPGSAPPPCPPRINIIMGILALLGSFALSIAMPVSVCGETIPFSDDQTEGQQPAPDANVKHNCILLKGSISDEIYPRLEKRVNELIDIAFERQADADVLNKRGKHFHGPVSLVWAGTRDLLELLTEYKGFEQSSEAGDIILGEKLKIKSKGSADYAKQLRKDQIERDVFAAIMQVAEGLGCSDGGQSKSEIDQGLNLMIGLVGEEASKKTMTIMKDWCAAIKIDPSTFDAKQMSLLDTEQESRAVVDALMKTDPIVGEIRQIVHKRFNGRSNLARVTAKVVNFSLSVTGYSPTVISPVSQIAWTIYIATQGGPEEAKLLQEVYFGKRFESRYKTLDACADLAVNGHNCAVLTKNPTLLAVSEWMIDRASEVHKMPIAAKPVIESTNRTVPTADPKGPVALSVPVEGKEAIAASYCH